MTDKEKREKAAAEAAQSLANEADRPRIRALEQARHAAPGYYARQPDQEPGIWRVDGVPGVPDGSGASPAVTSKVASQSEGEVS